MNLFDKHIEALLSRKRQQLAEFVAKTSAVASASKEKETPQQKNPTTTGLDFSSMQVYRRIVEHTQMREQKAKRKPKKQEER